MQAVRHSHQGRYEALGLRTLEGLASVPSDGVNPSNGTMVVTGANIHKAGKKNATSSIYTPAVYRTSKSLGVNTDGGYQYVLKTSKVSPSTYTGVSQGCFLIDVNKWGSFMNHFPAGTGRIGVINK